MMPKPNSYKIDSMYIKPQISILPHYLKNVVQISLQYIANTLYTLAGKSKEPEPQPMYPSEQSQQDSSESYNRNQPNNPKLLSFRHLKTVDEKKSIGTADTKMHEAIKEESKNKTTGTYEHGNRPKVPSPYSKYSLESPLQFPVYGGKSREDKKPKSGAATYEQRALNQHAPKEDANSAKESYDPLENKGLAGKVVRMHDYLRRNPRQYSVTQRPRYTSGNVSYDRKQIGGLEEKLAA